VATLDRNTGIFAIAIEDLTAEHQGINNDDVIATLTVAPDGSFHFSQQDFSQPAFLFRTERACGTTTEFIGSAGVTNNTFVEFVAVQDMVYSQPVVDIGPVPTTMMGDFDENCIIELMDHTAFVECLAGPDLPPAPLPPTTPQESDDVFTSTTRPLPLFPATTNGVPSPKSANTSAPTPMVRANRRLNQGRERSPLPAAANGANNAASRGESASLR
jgi:hypothetical protein